MSAIAQCLVVPDELLRMRYYVDVLDSELNSDTPK